jgi:hypothetical protein
MRCVVLCPYLTHIEPSCERGLRDLERAGFEVRRYPSSAAIDRSRCDVATTVLGEGFDELMWIDSDISFEAGDVARLREHGLPVVAGIYPKKGVQDFALHLEPGTTELKVGEGGGLADVRYVGAGFLLVRRGVFDDIQRTFGLPVCNARFGVPSVPYFLPMVVRDEYAAGGNGYWYLGEDYAFCERARQAGHRIVVDTTIRLGHVGKYTYSWEDAGQAVTRVTGATFSFGGGGGGPAKPQGSS